MRPARLAADVALEAAQRTLGHASLGTTSIYVSPEEVLMRREAATYHTRPARESRIVGDAASMRRPPE
ncbi:integrase [Burkholderia sp. Bp8963]|nr:integrase [Burkholderia sp. Bp8963]